MRVPGMKLKSSGLVASTFTGWASSQAWSLHLCWLGSKPLFPPNDMGAFKNRLLTCRWECSGSAHAKGSLPSQFPLLLLALDSPQRPCCFLQEEVFAFFPNTRSVFPGELPKCPMQRLGKLSSTHMRTSGTHYDSHCERAAPAISFYFKNYMNDKFESFLFRIIVCVHDELVHKTQLKYGDQRTTWSSRSLSGVDVRSLGLRG